jgi:hypothetical protein
MNYLERFYGVDFSYSSIGKNPYILKLPLRHKDTKVHEAFICDS